MKEKHTGIRQEIMAVILSLTLAVTAIMGKASQTRWNSGV